ncbi:MAG TPA: hypothetical protein VM344_04005 [Vitreimonas sp.]|nr:hypothetical protein [Vitreimonas sp.]
MRLRSLRAPIAILATLGLLAAMTAVPATAQSDTPTCEAVGASTGQVADGAILSYDSSFACTDAAASGTWSITVSVANLAESTTGVELTELTLWRTSPQPGGVGPDASLASDTLPLALAVDANGTFDASGAYELVTTDDGDKATLHLRLAGVTDDDEPFQLGINVQVLGPGLEPDLGGDNDENGENGENGDAGGRPEWVPGPPPWVIEMLRSIFTTGFPWGTDDFPPRLGPENGENGENGNAEGRPTWVPGPPPWAPVPAHAGAGNGGDGGDADESEEDAGPPGFVRPGGPPHDIPGQRRP